MKKFIIALLALFIGYGFGSFNMFWNMRQDQIEIVQASLEELDQYYQPEHKNFFVTDEVVVFIDYGDDGVDGYVTESEEWTMEEFINEITE